MQGHDPKDQNAAKMNRRKFLTRTGAGLVIASIPARSVWASSGGLTQSIVASGHGSDFANGHQLKLESPGYFRNRATSQNNLLFINVFGGPPIGVAAKNYNATLGDVLKNPGSKKLGGPANINFNLVGVYLNAFFSGSAPFDRIYYPIVGPDKPFATFQQFAFYLYEQATSSPESTSAALGNLITQYHG
ncbi:hypothetical protein [Alishewanella jeotgali]|uniref:Uncharacterized protein n=1 Tax=Alishewanella jeotgali KCTC 22429 TaxID=1129374 RepID=H3ZC86_9ALTE|nr:hypothetical protein [Alishewanella jeotgali]EHR41678.1 hypothetical protein AJE_04796 [Alishewanella jeotgali KCTC 22429]